MTISVPAYPLQWPEGLRRNPKPGGGSGFRTTLSAAIKNVRESLRLFGNDTGLPIRPGDIVFSSNYGGVGLEAVHETNPKDPGVAVWFEWDKQQRCIAVDKYDRIEHNVQAIHHIIEAERTKMRHGGLEIVRASFKGHIALPAPSVRHWRDVLGIVSTFPTVSIIEDAYKRLAKERHPDRGGSHAMMSELNNARMEALRECGQ